ncbi:MAG TPA: FAD binding domain-containing protein [Hyphomicrobiaceae bacterium]|nr:FAD binding domain-containing protein [Hyphomicrobiaceae bacterium]
MREFVYVAPPSIAEALIELSGDNARPLAGGTDLLPQLREGRRHADRVVDLKRIGELTTVRRLPQGGVEIGAAASATAVARHEAIAADYPAIAASARLLGSVQVQNRASIGGNVCNAAPSADVVPALMCHQATARVASGDGWREIGLEDFFTGPGKTVLKPGELLLSLALAPAPQRSATTYLRFTPRREMDIAIAGVAVRIDLAADHTIALTRIALAAVGPTPLRAPSAEAILRGHRLDREVAAAAAAAAANDARAISDTRASADYRRALTEVLTRRGIAACARSLNLTWDGP